mmetsp:Transcript_11157/g.38761  ORF Transcript_11157/g.38761 Transcript_11157/m.38761 type:complete len:523 (+) Transcript_11157:106-1674(+)
MLDGQTTCFLSANQLHNLFCKREVKPTDVISLIINRAKDYTQYNSFSHLFSRAYVSKLAEEAEERYERGSPKSQLDGIPIAIKDCFPVEGAVCSLGISAYASNVSGRSCALVKRLTEMGAIIVGMTTSDVGCGGGLGGNRSFGPVLNPRNTRLMSGGSSCGSACAVALGLCCIALGTDTSGSIRFPAAFTGVYGLKPTFGLISRAGSQLVTWTFDTVGIFSRSLKDIEITLDILRDSSCQQDEIRDVTDIDCDAVLYRSVLQNHQSTVPYQANFCVPPSLTTNIEKKIGKMFDVFVDTLISTGRFNRVFGDPATCYPNWIKYFLSRNIVEAESSVLHDSHLSPSFSQLCALDETKISKRQEATIFLFDDDKSQEKLAKQYQIQRFLEFSVDEWMVQNNCDVLVLPSSEVLPYPIHFFPSSGHLNESAEHKVFKDFFLKGGFFGRATFFNLTRQPCLCIPLGNKECWWSLQLVARKGNEDILFSISKYLPADCLLAFGQDQIDLVDDKVAREVYAERLFGHSS